ncbi:MAG: BlaI/MecI/CopY family transcriptional regulator [Candidatus Krumholzibacteria bacterium]|nr:BlaI/MecI/CopY family transcriptional regulator [Candidatus Krumholzibacteria bacterium]
MEKRPDLNDLTRRERQIMDIVYRMGNATAVDVMERLSDNPVNATVRTMLSVLEEKGFLWHESEKGRYVYYPTIPLTSARNKVLDNILETFFRGAEANAVISILKKSEAKLSDEERKMIIDLIGRSKKEGR